VLTQEMAQRRNLLFVICLLGLGAFVFFYRLGDRDMWTRLESEAAVAGRDMLDTGRILVPHFFDQPFVDNRPPGAFWLVAASYKLTGRRDEWARSSTFGAGCTGVHPPGLCNGKEGRERDCWFPVCTRALGDVDFCDDGPDVTARYAAHIVDHISLLGVLEIA